MYLGLCGPKFLIPSPFSGLGQMGILELPFCYQLSTSDRGHRTATQHQCFNYKLDLQSLYLNSHRVQHAVFQKALPSCGIVLEQNQQPLMNECASEVKKTLKSRR